MVFRFYGRDIEGRISCKSEAFHCWRELNPSLCIVCPSTCSVAGTRSLIEEKNVSKDGEENPVPRGRPVAVRPPRISSFCVTRHSFTD